MFKDSNYTEDVLLDRFSYEFQDRYYSLNNCIIKDCEYCKEIEETLKKHCENIIKDLSKE